MKCLLHCAIVITTLTFSLCENYEEQKEVDNLENLSPKLQKDLDLKNSLSDSRTEDKRAWHASSWGKRKWPGMNVWGKRKWMNAWGKRKWAAMGTWGKRSDPLIDSGLENIHKRDTEHSFPLKRKWNQFVTWGKRSVPIQRKWASVSLWGKRSHDNVNESEKRKWSALTSWGKRDDIGDINSDKNKRKWAMSAWGKRTNLEDEDNDMNKKWALASWGKRDDIYKTPSLLGKDVDSDNIIDKRKWSNFSSWGKRMNLQNWRKRPWLWAKRRRGWSAMSSWGKRSSLDTKQNAERQLLSI